MSFYNEPQDRPEEQSRTFIFLDEFPRLKRIARLLDLMTMGRSKGVTCFLGFQDVSDVQAAYGKEMTATITGTCDSALFLKAGSAEHAEWAEKRCGYEEVIQLSTTRGSSSTVGSGGSSTTTSESASASEKIRPIFLKDEFLALEKPGVRTPVRPIPQWIRNLTSDSWLRWIVPFYTVSLFTPFQGIACMQGRVYQTEMSFTRTLDALRPPSGQNFQPRDESEQFLKTWAELEEGKPLAIRGNPEPAPVTNLKSSLWNIFRRATDKANK